MSFFSSNIGRVPNLLLGRTSLSTIQRTSYDLFRASGQLSTGLAIARPSDDAVRAAAVTELDARLERGEQVVRNLSLASSNLGILDSTIAELSNLAQEGQTLAVAQANVGPAADERSAQASVVEAMLDSVLRLSNQKSVSGYIFGGTNPGNSPVREVGGSYVFRNQVGGLTPDLGIGRSVQTTLGAGSVIGSLSSRVRGAQALDPALTEDTRVADLRGARGVGVALGEIEMIIDGTDVAQIDLTGADSVGDVLDRIEAAIRRIEIDENKTVLGPTDPVSIEDEKLRIDTAGASTVEFRDIAGGRTARDLGLERPTPSPFAGADPLGEDLRPRLTKRTPIDSLQALTAPLGEVVIENNGFSTTIDLSNAKSVSEIESAFESAGVYVEVEIDPDGETLSVVNRLSSSQNKSLSIRDADDGTQTASRLGLRSFQPATRIADFNFGRGVDVLEGNPDPSLNVDFDIVLGDGVQIPIDLSSADLTTVESVIDEINQQISDFLADPSSPTTTINVTATITDTNNGFTLQQTGSANPLTIAQRNNSPAAAQLGLLQGTYNTTTDEFEGIDPARVRVNNIFTHLIDLSDALRGDDVFGIQLASDQLRAATDLLTDTRAVVGGYARRVEDEMRQEEDRSVLDQQIRSELRDANFAEVATRYSQLQTQLEAGLRTAGLSSSLSLLDYL